MSDYNLLKNKIPIHRRKKEIIILIFIGIFTFSTIYYYSYIKYLPLTNSDIPRIKIFINDDLNYDDYVNCTFELISKNSEETILPIESKIRIRGSGTNWNERSPKKGYRLELSERISLLGMRKDDDWILFDMYYDFPKMRVKMCFDLWRSLQDSDPTAILPDSEYVCLFINNDFKGLYLLAEKNDRRLFNLDDELNNIDSSLIFNLQAYWEQSWPNEDDGIYIVDEIIEDLNNFITNTSDYEFFNSETNIYTKFDKLNLIDFYIYNFFILHRDFWHGNYFLVRNSAPSKFYLIPWDFDYSFGQFGGYLLSANLNDEDEIKEFNDLYKRLIGNEEFMESCKHRWNFLRETLWTEEYIMDIISDIYEEINFLIELDNDIWEPFNFKEPWKNKVDESIDHLFQWIPERLEFCDDYFLSNN